MRDSVEVRPSKLDGVGLFSTKFILKGEKFTYYEGKVLPDVNVLDLGEEQYKHFTFDEVYFIITHYDYTVPCDRKPPGKRDMLYGYNYEDIKQLKIKSYGSLINDADWHQDLTEYERMEQASLEKMATRMKSIKVSVENIREVFGTILPRMQGNCMFQNFSSKRYSMVAIKNIEKGEEISLHYGIEYWRNKCKHAAFHARYQKELQTTLKKFHEKNQLQEMRQYLRELKLRVGKESEVLSKQLFEIMTPNVQEVAKEFFSTHSPSTGIKLLSHYEKLTAQYPNDINRINHEMQEYETQLLEEEKKRKQSQEKKCCVCGKLENKNKRLGACGYCKRENIEILYCSKECQKNDWPNHKTTCCGRKK